MKTWEALVTMELAIQGRHEPIAALENAARAALREIGMRRDEIDGEYPDHVIQQALELITQDKVLFRSMCQRAAACFQSLN